MKAWPMETSFTPGTARRNSLRLSRLRSWPALTSSPAACAARAAQAAGLEVNAGHDLSRDNLTDFLRVVRGVREVSIGHAFVSDALELGYAAATREYLRRIEDAR